MFINLSRGTQKFSCAVLYNFHQVSNVIVLRCDKEIVPKNNEMILMLNPLTKAWYDIDLINESDPVFFAQIMDKLKNLTAEAERATENVLSSTSGKRHTIF